jgi:GNAT superfamily N-acetyltransferase
MDAAVSERAERFWSERLACPIALLRTPGVHLRARPDAGSLFVVQVEGCSVVVAPVDLHAALAAFDAGPLGNPKALQGIVPRGARFVGPAFVGYGAGFPAASTEVERVPGARSPAVARLRGALTAEEWEHANLEAAGELFTISAEGSVVAACGFATLLRKVAHLGVATHPDHRGRGLGRRVVSAAASAALARGLLPQYQTLFANRAALAVGEALGFERFATTLAVQWGAGSVRR